MNNAAITLAVISLSGSVVFGSFVQKYGVPITGSPVGIAAAAFIVWIMFGVFAFAKTL